MQAARQPNLVRHRQPQNPEGLSIQSTARIILRSNSCLSMHYKQLSVQIRGISSTQLPGKQLKPMQKTSQKEADPVLQLGTSNASTPLRPPCALGSILGIPVLFGCLPVPSVFAGAPYISGFNKQLHYTYTYTHVRLNQALSNLTEQQVSPFSAGELNAPQTLPALTAKGSCTC